MKNREYFRVARLIMPKFIVVYIISMSILTPLIMTISALFGAPGSFLISMVLFPYAVAFMGMITPMSGASPSVKKSLSSAAQARELRGGSSGIYDMLCVMPITRRQIVSCYMSFMRLYVGVLSAICIVILIITDNEWLPFLAIAAFTLVLMMNMTSAAAMTKLEKPVIILTLILYIVTIIMYMLNMFDNIIVPISVPNYVVILFIIIVNVLHEIIMRATHLSPKKFYARNGEQINS